MSKWDAVIGKISEFIRQVVNNAGADGVVVGVSGGVDSACVVTLCEKALGSSRVTGLIMPEEGLTPKEDIRDAVNLCKKLDIKHHVIEINPFIESFVNIVGRGNERAYANLKPRIRMIILYFHANNRNMLVAGTGNKTELAVGYFTKYGDGGVDFLPIGDLYKTEVFQLAEHLGVPEGIIRKTPSAGLWKGQTDEVELGIAYEELDNILKILSKEKEEVKSEKYERVLQMIDRSAHKREMPPFVELRSLVE